MCGRNFKQNKDKHFTCDFSKSRNPNSGASDGNFFTNHLMRNSMK